jgi:hypothetical protein
VKRRSATIRQRDWSFLSRGRGKGEDAPARVHEWKELKDPLEKWNIERKFIKMR